jgi:hypothetical protein
MRLYSACPARAPAVITIAGRRRNVIGFRRWNHCYYYRHRHRYYKRLFVLSLLFIVVSINDCAVPLARTDAGEFQGNKTRVGSPRSVRTAAVTGGGYGSERWPSYHHGAYPVQDAKSSGRETLKLVRRREFARSAPIGRQTRN